LLKIAVLISGGGSNLQSIIDSINCGELICEIKCVISDRAGAYGLERAKEYGIPAYVLERKIYGERLSDEILSLLSDDVDFIVLAGFLSILSGNIISVFKDRLINIHPSLIPSFCGKGMYGMKVHQKVIESGVKVSGCTVHFVDEETDSGPIILQRTVPVYFEDDAAALQKRILIEEHKALPEALKLLLMDRVKIVEKKVKIS
jgi:phosphoribosylglycinamide formyltransferase 1